MSSQTATASVEELFAETPMKMELTKEEVETPPEKALRNFREHLSKDDLQRLKDRAPAIAESMEKNFGEIIEFGREVQKKVDDKTSELLKEQEKVEIPRADELIGNLIADVEGYERKYSQPDGTLTKLIRRLRRGSGVINGRMKAMVNDSKKISEKMDLIYDQIEKMEIGLNENVRRGHELRNSMIEAIPDVIKVLAALEGICEAIAERGTSMKKAYDEQSGGGIIEWNGKKYTREELEELILQNSTAYNETDKTWMAWRQKLFLYMTNIAASRNIINTSFTLQRSCASIRTHAIPAAKTQLAAWQQAEEARRVAEVSINTNQGVNDLIASASNATTETVALGLKANEQTLLSDETIKTLTKNLTQQLKDIVESEQKSKEIRTRQLELINESEKTIADAMTESREALIKAAFNTIAEDKQYIEGKQGSSFSSLGLS